MTKKKKKIIIVVSLVAAVVIALTVTLCVIFIPRKLTNIVPTEGITKVTYLYSDAYYEREQDIGEENLDEFEGYLSNVKYRFTNENLLGRSTPRICIYYDDGDKMIIDAFRLYYYTGGKAYVNSWDLYNDHDLYKFYKRKEVKPDGLTNKIPLEDIKKVAYEYHVEDDTYEQDIGEENLEEFKGYLSNAEYDVSSEMLTDMNPIQICIYYNNGDKIVFDEFRCCYYLDGQVYTCDWELKNYRDLWKFYHSDEVMPTP